MKLLKKKFIIPAVIASVIAASGVIMAVASPGDSNDPIITLSYINDTVIPQLKEYIDSKISNSNQGQTVTGNAVYNLVNVRANHKIIGNEGTEFVVRTGEGTIVATSNGGVSDLTDGKDLTDGTVVPLNHHLLAPRTDSRGIHMDTDGIILIKGTYTVIPD